MLQIGWKLFHKILQKNATGKSDMYFIENFMKAHPNKQFCPDIATYSWADFSVDNLLAIVEIKLEIKISKNAYTHAQNARQKICRPIR